METIRSGCTRACDFSESSSNRTKPCVATGTQMNGRDVVDRGRGDGSPTQRVLATVGGTVHACQQPPARPPGRTRLRERTRRRTRRLECNARKPLLRRPPRKDKPLGCSEASLEWWAKVRSTIRNPGTRAPEGQKSPKQTFLAIACDQGWC
eukprot:scaffold626_cov337-Pavlova_lutheri.AAC.12